MPETADTRINAARSGLENSFYTAKTRLGHSGSYFRTGGRAENYLFIGSEGAAKAAAIAYTLIETAKLSGVDLQVWLTDTLGRISDHKITRLDELMPWRYAQT